MTAKELYRLGLEKLEEAETEDAGFDALQLFSHYTGIDRAKLLADGNASVSEEMVKLFLSAVRRRATGEPLQYILGEWEFYSLPFQVGQGVLIPRADTEILVDEALRLLEGMNAPKIADLCTGSGCIAISIAKNRPEAEITAVEWSDTAAAYCKQNIALNGVTNVTLKMADVLAGPGECNGFDLIVSNPPYIPTADMAALSREVHNEPSMALDGGEDGLIFYRSIIDHWYSVLSEEGMMAFEVGIHQADVVATLLSHRFEQVYIVPDLNDIPRVILGVQKKS